LSFMCMVKGFLTQDPPYLANIKFLLFSLLIL
jgi:hypothetical protein